MGNTKRLAEDIEELIEEGLDDYDISKRLCEKYGLFLEEDDWLSKKIAEVRKETKWST